MDFDFIAKSAVSDINICMLHLGDVKRYGGRMKVTIPTGRPRKNGFLALLRLKYRDMSAAGTAGGTCAPITTGAEPARNLAIPRTTGMPHRPSSSDGHTSIFVSSNPIGLRYRLSKCARRCAGLSPAIGGFGSAAVPIVSHRRRTVRHGFYRIPEHTGSRYRGIEAARPARPATAKLMLLPVAQD
jgi:hypothetical protein